MNKTVALLLVLVSLAASSLIIDITPAEVASQQNTWTSKSSMPTPRYRFGLAVLDGKIYAIGGIGLGVNEEYNPVTDTWTEKQAMPTPRSDFGIAVYRDKIYVMGGQITNPATGIGVPCSVNEVYDPLTDTWETKTQMPTARMNLNAEEVDGKIYLIGGMQGNQEGVSKNEVYDPVTDSWETKAGIPHAVYSYASAVIDKRVYVISGQGDNLNQIYDAVTDTWSSGTPIPTALIGAVAVATMGVNAPRRIYVVSGWQNMDTSGLNQVYDPASNSWSSGMRMPTSVGGASVAAVDDLIYMIGGFTWDTGSLNTNEQYTPFGYGTVPPHVHVLSPEIGDYTSDNVSLAFTVNKPALWMGYSLDGQDNVTVGGNISLSGLFVGLHNVTVYAEDEFENIGASDTVIFSIITKPEPFPTALVATGSGVLVAAVVGFGLLVYFRKRHAGMGDKDE
jgi:N-acetylneuraminic acid mutarotase